MHHDMCRDGASGMWGDGESHCSQAELQFGLLPHKECPQDQPITNGGEEGVFTKSRWCRRPNVHMPVYDPIFISSCILKPKPPAGFITVHT